jgi:hypothetical protein
MTVRRIAVHPMAHVGPLGAEMSSLLKPIRYARSRPTAGADLDLWRKADICARILAEARKFSDLGQLGGPLNQLVVRASELLEDIDAILIGVDPATSGLFAIAANLHRELEFLQADITAQRRHAASTSRGGRNR